MERESTPRFSVRIPDVDFWKDMVPCQAACPVHTDAGRYVQLIAEGQFEQAYLTARAPNPFASVCGRICAAPCEDRCRRGVIDAPVSIRALKRFVTERYGVESLAPETQEKLFQIAPLSPNGAGPLEPGNKEKWHLPLLTQSRGPAGGRSVAVIGAGAAGLACAHDLALMGYRVTVFEASSRAGGMMVHGIPEFRLGRSLIDKEIDRIESLGVEVRYQTPLSAEFGLQALREQGYEAVFLGVGAQSGRDIQVPGADLDGVIKAVEYLLNVNQGYRVTLGSRVVVLGGGFVAFDAARLALRDGAAESAEEGAMTAALDAARAARRAGVRDVVMVSLESFAEMPVMRTAQGREEFEEARHEGVRFLTQRGVRRFSGKAGKLETIELIGVQRTYDENGRFAPVFDESVIETLDADTVILAIGQQVDLGFLRPEDGVDLTPQGTVRVDRASLATSADWVFAGGDAAFGPRNLIEAVANGKRAALSIDEYLRGGTSQTTFRLKIDKIPTRDYTMPEDYEQHARQSPPTTDLGRRTGISEVETGYGEAEARLQAERCLHCHVQTIYDPEKCILCNRCVDVCPERCLRLIPAEQLGVEHPEEVWELYGLDGQAPDTLAAMIKDDESCIRCGLCAIRCPTDAMTMEVFFYEEVESIR